MDIILLPVEEPLKLKPKDLLISTSASTTLTEESELTRQWSFSFIQSHSVIKPLIHYDLGRPQRLHLGRYRKLFPSYSFFSLTQNPTQRPRHEDLNQHLMTLTTSMDLWLQSQMESARHWNMAIVKLLVCVPLGQKTKSGWSLGRNSC